MGREGWVGPTVGMGKGGWHLPDKKGPGHVYLTVGWPPLSYYIDYIYI